MPPNAPAVRLVAMFGGGKKLSQAIGVTPAIVSHWINDGERSTGGEVPTRYNARIVAAADRLKLDAKAVRACLDWICPECGQKFG